MKYHMAAYILHPVAFVQDFLQLVDIISWIGQNKNTLVMGQCPVDRIPASCYYMMTSGKEMDTGFTWLKGK